MGPHWRARALEYLAKAKCTEIQPAPRLYRLASYKLLCALDNQLLVSTGLGLAAYRTKRSMQPGAASSSSSASSSIASPAVWAKDGS